jgi:hypothetical protein
VPLGLHKTPGQSPSKMMAKLLENDLQTSRFGSKDNGATGEEDD